MSLTSIGLSTHFTLEQLCASSTAQRLIIDNTPPTDVVDRLRILAEGLEKIRALLDNHPLYIDSGYRCTTLNRAVCGAPNSAHLLGYAADFVCPAFGMPNEIVTKIKTSYLHFDQVIQEGTWVHISFDPKLRNEVLTAHFGPNGTRYTPISA
jgi:zinc D-Ala-D-Ala carboxypeptidase